MQNKKSVAYIVAAAATVVLSILRVLLAPSLAGKGGGALAVVTFLLIPLAAVALLFLSPKHPPVAPAAGRSLLSFGALFSGVLMLITAVWEFIRWRTQGVFPFPAPTTVTPLATVFFVLLCVFALLGGVFFVLQGIAWTRGKPLGGWLPLLALAPLFWSWVRICRYETSYCSSLYVLRHWYDLAALLFETVFFLLLARLVMRPEKAPRFLCGLSLATGVLLTAACVTRVAMALLGEEVAFGDCALLSAADLGIAVLAFGFAKAYVPSEEGSAKEDPLPVPDGEEDENDMLLLPLNDESPLDTGDDTVYDDVQPTPLELEDMILRMMQNPDDEEK